MNMTFWKRMLFSILLAADGQEIVWVVGYRISERYRVREDAEKIIQDSKSRKTGKCKVFRTKIQHCRSGPGKAVKAGKNCTDGKIDADRFPK